MVVCTGYLKSRLYLNKHFVILNLAACKHNDQPVFTFGDFLAAHAADAHAQVGNGEIVFILHIIVLFFPRGNAFGREHGQAV